MRGNDTLIFLPTYNEADHVPVLFERIVDTGVAADILFMDDGSPDGTGESIDTIAAAHDNVHAIHRPGKSGIGGAHLDGIAYAYEHGYRTLVTMDTDLVHRPENIPAFLDASATHDIVIGTRFRSAESLAEWDLFRKVLTHLGHVLTRLLLRHAYDATGSFRVYRLDRIDRAVFALVEARDYEFFFTSLTILHLNGYTIVELPIDLPWRTYGTSKMELRHMVKSVLMMVKLGWRCRFGRDRLLVTPNRS